MANGGAKPAVPGWFWAVAVIAIVGIVVAAVKAYVTSQAGNIK